MHTSEGFLKAYDFKDKVFAITGGNGVLGGEMVIALAGLGARVAIIDRGSELNPEIAKSLGDLKANCLFLEGNVLQTDTTQHNLEAIIKKWGRIDGLVNGAGGNQKGATTSTDQSFFDLVPESIRAVVDLNLLGTIIPCQVFARYFAEQKQGHIVNISSMNAFRPLTRIPGYSAAKAAVSNFTQWLAVHMAQEYAPEIRVNAIAPGFFLTEQNRFLLTDEKTGELTERGRQIIDHTPMGKFGEPADLIGTLLWLLSDASSFVTGIVVPVDGGFSAFSGV